MGFKELHGSLKCRCQDLPGMLHQHTESCCLTPPHVFYTHRWLWDRFRCWTSWYAYDDFHSTYSWNVVSCLKHSDNRHSDIQTTVKETTLKTKTSLLFLVTFMQFLDRQVVQIVTVLTSRFDWFILIFFCSCDLSFWWSSKSVFWYS